MKNVSKFYFVLLVIAFSKGKSIIQKNTTVLRVAVNLISPFAVLNDPEVNMTNKYKMVKKNQITGLEVAAFDLIAKSLNLKVKYFAKNRNPNNMFYGQILKNGTTTGLFHDLKMEKFDAAIGFIKNIPLMNRHFQVTKQWLEDDFVFCMKKVYTNRNWSSVISMFSSKVRAIFLVIILLLTAILWKIGRKTISFSHWFYTTTFLFFGANAVLPKYTSHRIVTGGLIILGTYIAIQIQSNWLTRLAQGQTADLILTPLDVRDLFNQNPTIYYNPYDRHYFDDNIKNKLKNSRACYSLGECLDFVTDNPNSVTILAKLPLGSVRYVPQFLERVRCSDKVYVKYGLVFIFRNGTGLAKKFTEKTNHLVEQALTTPQFMFVKTVPFVVKDKVFGNVLGLEYLVAIFKLWMVGMGLAFIVFCLEHLVFWMKNDTRKPRKLCALGWWKKK